MREYAKAKEDSVSGIIQLKQRLSGPEAREPESIKILKTKNEKEKEYLQRTIIMMELKQLAESITMIAYKKKLQGKALKANFKNRPCVWAERIDDYSQIA